MYTLIGKTILIFAMILIVLQDQVLSIPIMAGTSSHVTRWPCLWTTDKTQLQSLQLISNPSITTQSPRIVTRRINWTHSGIGLEIHLVESSITSRSTDSSLTSFFRTVPLTHGQLEVLPSMSAPKIPSLS